MPRCKRKCLGGSSRKQAVLLLLPFPILPCGKLREIICMKILPHACVCGWRERRKALRASISFPLLCLLGFFFGVLVAAVSSYCHPAREEERRNSVLILHPPIRADFTCRLYFRFRWPCVSYMSFPGHKCTRRAKGMKHLASRIE